MTRRHTRYETLQEDKPGMSTTRRQTRCDTSQEDKRGMRHDKKTLDVFDMTRKDRRCTRYAKRTDEV
jgi:hypothetical protein